MADIIRKRNHHLLKNDGKEILIFGLKSAVRMMSRTKMLLADGTFKCLLTGFSKLHLFHAIVKNNVSLPMLFCLVKGKDGGTYTRLLQLIEELAVDNETSTFGGPVTLICDLEASFINAVKVLYKSVVVKCCFFHFIKNLRTNASPVMTTIRRHGGKHTDAYKLAQRIKRRLMMIPLLPRELIWPEVVRLILRVWDRGCPKHEVHLMVWPRPCSGPTSDGTRRPPPTPVSTHRSGALVEGAFEQTTLLRASTHSSIPKSLASSPSSTSSASLNSRWRSPGRGSKKGVSPGLAQSSPKRTAFLQLNSTSC